MNLIPLEHKKFANETDAEYIDVEDLNPEYLAKTTNLTPFRKEGSLRQFGGTSIASLEELELTKANMPSPSGFVCKDFYAFSVDRDNKEIIILVYENDTTGEIKLYVNPYYNPDIFISNNNPNKDPDSWIYEWLELTESYTGTIDSATGTSLVLNEHLSGTDDYFNGWFVTCDRALQDNAGYTFITDYDQATDTYTTKTSVASASVWPDGATVRIYRFPVLHFYNAEVPTPHSVPYTGEATTFKGKPTQFIYSNNELRMPCGKELRPLILSMIFKRKYFMGNEEIVFDGFWLDFQQIPQIMHRSIVSSFAAIGGVSKFKLRGSRPYLVAFSDPAPNYIEWENNSTNFYRISMYDASYSFTGNGYGPDGFYWIHGGGLESPFGVKVVGNTIIIVVNIAAGTGTRDLDLLFQLLTFFFPVAGYPFTITLTGNEGFVLSGSSVPDEWDLLPESEEPEPEAQGNKVSKNLFLGAEFEVPVVAIGGSVKATPFILSILVDSRNEIILSQGRMHTNPDPGTPTYFTDASKLKFNCWFSRRITDVKLYNYAEETPVADQGKIFFSSVYPYFKWIKDVDVNSMPLNNTYSIYDFTKNPLSEIYINYLAFKNVEQGMLAYTHDSTNGYWYTKFAERLQNLAEVPTGLKWTSETGRFVHDEITMNYIRGCFSGGINGFLFIINCKNTINDPVFENDDFVLRNVLSSGVSSYDIFTQDNLSFISLGDKDINREIQFYDGYLLIIKDTNVFALDIATDGDLKYRIIKTDVGRGAINPNSICTTPYGVIMPAKDSVYLLTRSGTRQILTPTNGRLDFYRTQFAYSNIHAVYYNAFNEVLLVQSQDTDLTTRSESVYGMLYSFSKNAWTTIAFNPVKNNFLRTRTNANREVIMLNSVGTDFCIVKFDENSSTQFAAAETEEPIFWTLKSHMIPYGSKVFDLKLNTFTLNYDYLNNPENELTLVVSRNGQANESKSLLTSGTSQQTNKVFNQLLEQYGASDQIAIQLTNSDSYSNITINSFILWITKQQRQLRQT